jgi:hypothetical protein
MRKGPGAWHARDTVRTDETTVNASRGGHPIPEARSSFMSPRNGPQRAQAGENQHANPRLRHGRGHIASPHRHRAQQYGSANATALLAKKRAAEPRVGVRIRPNGWGQRGSPVEAVPIYAVELIAQTREAAAAARPTLRVINRLCERTLPDPGRAVQGLSPAIRALRTSTFRTRRRRQSAALSSGRG